ncbi:MAG: hypothetical protein JW839_07825 [Candidatus Lokiarchaeota archaeon]|nr:hypothetical protein [Candidatus Lokiarchaeota archaeon]
MPRLRPWWKGVERRPASGSRNWRGKHEEARRRYRLVVARRRSPGQPLTGLDQGEQRAGKDSSSSRDHGIGP